MTSRETPQHARRSVSGVDGTEIRSLCVSPATAKAYASYVRSISRWIHNTLPNPEQYFHAPFALNLAYFTPQIFEDFIVFQLNHRSKQLSITTLSGYRSAVKDQYRQQRLAIPDAYDGDMKAFFSGLKRMQNDCLQKGSSKESGKQPMSYSMYNELSLICTKLPSPRFLSSNVSLIIGL